MNKANIISAIMKAGMAACLVFAFSACSKQNLDDEAVVPQQPSQPQEELNTSYSDDYRLYVIEDDTTVYKPSDNRRGLTPKENAIGRSLSSYAVKMLIDYDGDRQNTVLSPMSATLLYSMMANFANTDATSDANEYMSEIGLDPAVADDMNSYQRRIACLEENADARDDAETSFSVENEMFIQEGREVYNSFLSTTRSYKVKVKGVDFNNKSEMSQINNAIRKHVGENSVGISTTAAGGTASLVSSSLSFQQLWKTPFGIDSIATVFTDTSGGTVERKMLVKSGKSQFCRFGGYSMLELPYKGDKFSMFVLLPDENKTLAQTLTAVQKAGLPYCMEITGDTTRTFHGTSYSNRKEKIKIIRYRSGYDPETVFETDTIVTDTLETDTILNIRIPKFKFSGTMALNSSSLQNTAKSRLYTANLKKVSPGGFTLSNIWQSCCIEITREGTKASAKGELPFPVINTINTGATAQNSAIIIRPSHDYYERVVPQGKRSHETVVEPFFVNRPFTVFIRENLTGAILFSASIKTLD